MPKKVVSVINSRHHKKKPSNKQYNYIHKNKKVKTILMKISNYFKSDTYMFSPIASAPSSASLGEGLYEPMKKKNWLKEVEEYLNCDCYMYAPLIFQHSVSAPTKGSQSREKVSTSCIHTEMEQRTTEETRRPAGEITLTPLQRVVVKHIHMEQETHVKRVLHEDPAPASSFAQGKVQLQKEPSEIVVK